MAKFKDRDLNELRDILNQLAEESGSNSYTTSSEVRKYLNDKNIKTAKELTDEIKRQHLELRKLYSSAKGLYNVFKANLDELNDFKKGPIEATQALNNLVKLSTKLRDDAIGINRLNDKDLKRLITKIELAKKFSDETLRSMETNGQTDKEAYTQLKKTENEQKELLQTAKDRLIVENEVGKRLGLSGAAIQSMTTILKTFNLTNLSGIDELNDELKETALLTKKSKTELAGIAIKGIGKEVKSHLTDPLVRIGLIGYGIKQVIDYVLKADEGVTNLAKSLTVSKSEAWGIRDGFRQTANSLHDSYTTAEDMVKSNSEISKELGISKVYSSDINTEWINITKKFGASVESAKLLTMLSIAHDKSLKSVKESTYETIYNLGAEAGIRLDIKDIMDDIGKVSGQILSNYQGNPIALAKAVTQIKLLGSNMEQTKSQADGLLNFQSSIESELKAELLINKSINLEKARAAALSGDYITVQKELVNQSMDFNEFSKLNVIQQNALAESLGLSSNELSNQLMYLKYQGMSRENITSLAGEEIAKRVESLTLQDKFNKSIEKLKELFVGIMAGPIGKFLDLLVEVINSPVGSALIGGIGGFALGGIPGAVIGAAGGFGAYYANDMMLPQSHNEKAILTPQGTYHLNNNDSVIAGTNLFDRPNNKNYTENTIDLSPLLLSINSMRDDIKQLVSKQNNIYMDSRKVGTSLHLGVNKSA